MKTSNVKVTKPKSLTLAVAGVSKSVVDHGKYTYGRVRVRDSKGKAKVVVSNGDAVARAMSYLSVEETNGLVKKLDLAKPKSSLNAGQKKMSIANSLRALVRSGVSVKVGDFVVRNLDQKRPEFNSNNQGKTKKR